MYIVHDEVTIQLKYTGSDVDDGTMSVEDMIPALQGFASAYGKIVNTQELQVTHKLRIVGIKKGSFDILLQVLTDAVNAAKDNAAPLIGTGALGYFVIKKIVGVIQLTKHIKNQPFTTNINGNSGSVVVINTERLQLEVPHEILQLYQSKTLQPDIGKIVKPLEEGKIDSTEILVKEDGKVLEERITVHEKKYFEVEPIVVTKTETTVLSGFFVSLFKTTNNGYFILTDGTRVTYHLANERPEELWPLIVAKGGAKITCVVHLDENLKPARLDVSRIELVQNSLAGLG